MLNPSLKNHFM